jgi:hypothetical protein
MGAVSQTRCAAVRFPSSAPYVPRGSPASTQACCSSARAAIPANRGGRAVVLGVVPDEVVPRTQTLGRPLPVNDVFLEQFPVLIKDYSHVASFK